MATISAFAPPLDEALGFEDFMQHYVATLPWAQHIDRSDAAAWLGKAKSDPFQSLGQHFYRLTGFGGDIGTLVASSRGEYTFFRSARDVISDRLMRTPPSLPEEEEGGFRIQRAVELRPVVQSLALRGNPVTVRPDLLSTLRKTQDADHPWLYGVPHDVWEHNGQHFLVLYKTPSDPLVPGGLSLDQEVQAHLCGHIYQQAFGKPPAGLLLAALNYREYQADLIEVGQRPALTQEALEVGDFYWREFLLRGELPGYNRKRLPPGDFDQDELDRIRELGGQLAAIGQAAKQLDAMKDLLEQELQSVATRNGDLLLSQIKKPEVPLGSLTTRKSLDPDAYTTFLAQRALEPTQFGIRTDTLDADAMADKLRELGHEPVYKIKPDVDAILAYCNDAGIRAPIREGVGITVKASKRLPKDALAVLQGDIRMDMEHSIAVITERFAEPEPLIIPELPAEPMGAGTADSAPTP